jgi:hypothetical protein
MVEEEGDDPDEEEEGGESEENLPIFQEVNLILRQVGSPSSSTST